MTDPDFKLLVNEYLDGELSGERLEAFKQEVRTVPGRRQQLEHLRKLHVAERLAVRCKPTLRSSFFNLSIFRLCRGGALAMNAAILLFAVGNFRSHEPSIGDLTLPNAAATVSTQDTGTDAAPTVVTLDDFDDTPSPDASSSLLTEDYAFVRL